MRKGLLIIVSGPSGVGKGTICKNLLRYKENILLSISATTRERRTGEIPDVDYYFLSREEFKGMIERNEFLEHAQFCGNYYGTPRSVVNRALDQGKDVILEIEVQGAMKVKENFPEGVFVFVLAPSMRELRQRLEQRNTEDSKDIDERLKAATVEMGMLDNYDYILMNDQVESASKRLWAIIEAEKSNIKRNSKYIKEVLEA